MGVRNARWWPGLFVLLVLQFFPTCPVHAAEQGITIFSVTQQDLNGDGRPDLTIIDCAFVTDHDRIYVFDQGNDMRTSTNWREATDFTNDIWLYDIGADESVQLIVVYRIEAGLETAYLYDDQDGDGQVSYQRAGTQIQIRESPYWTGRITSGLTWYRRDGRLNLNVHFALDGPMPTLDRMDDAYRLNWMKHDGRIDVEFEAVAGRDGIMQYALRHLVAPSPDDWGFEHSWLYSNEGHYPTKFLGRAFFPFLHVYDSSDPQYGNLRYFDLPPNVTVDWLHGKIQKVELEGYPIGHGYHCNNNQYIVNERINDVAFECPQAYYDLANNHDAFPELHIRFFTRPPGDPTMWSPEGTSAIPWQSVSYSWVLSDSGLNWDFKIGLGGNHQINSVVQFPGFALRMVPFAELPRWVTERQWKLATFVAKESEGYPSTEGIYEWQTDGGEDPEGNGARALETREASFGFMEGVTSIPPDSYFNTIRRGYRAERNFSGPIQPYLYLSAIDRRLHLRGAQAGVWNIDDQHIIRYANLNGDAYLDQWQYVENGRLRRQLWATKDYLGYAGEGAVLLKQAHIKPSLFDALPPTNHEEWLSSREKLQANQPNFVPGDFKAMLEQFDGPEMRITGATLRDYRLVGADGFRFVLTLQPGFQAQSTHLLDTRGLKPGDYVVSYNGHFTLKPLTAPTITASILSAAPTELEQTAIQIALSNHGLQDVPRATLEFWAAPAQGKATLVQTQTVDLLAQMPFTSTLQWTPPLAGEWALIPKIREPDGQLITFEPSRVTVLSANVANSGALIAASTSPYARFLVVLSLLTFASIAAAIFLRYWRTDRRGRE